MYGRYRPFAGNFWIKPPVDWDQVIADKQTSRLVSSFNEINRNSIKAWLIPDEANLIKIWRVRWQKTKVPTEEYMKFYEPNEYWFCLFGFGIGILNSVDEIQRIVSRNRRRIWNQIRLGNESLDSMKRYQPLWKHKPFENCREYIYCAEQTGMIHKTDEWVR